MSIEKRGRSVGKDEAAEGDVNLTPRRKRWEAENLGPRTRSMLAEDAKHFLHQSLSTPCFNALKSASGIWLEDLEGRRIMDFHGNSVHQVGHGHPRVLEAVRRALDTLPFSPRRFTNGYAVALAAKLAGLAPGDLGKSLFAPGGAEAVFRRAMGPLMPGTEHVQPCDPRSCHFGCGGECNARCADYVEYVLAKEEDVAAVVVETVRSTDVQVPPRAYYERLRAACDRHGALLVLDEIPICLGRTGSMFAFERYGIVPDMVVLGKGLGGGVFPMAALLVREGLDVAADRALGHFTHEKSPAGCAAALATLEVIESEYLLERANRLGALALARLREMRQRRAAVVDVRGVGLLLGVELEQAALAEDVMYRCLARGLSFKVGQGNVIVLAPPLVIEESDLEQALAILDQAIGEAAA